MDNSRTFRSRGVEGLCKHWRCNDLYRGSSQAAGARNYRDATTVRLKRLRAKKGGIQVSDAVDIYNRTPRGPLYAVPAEIMFGRKWPTRWSDGPGMRHGRARKKPMGRQCQRQELNNINQATQSSRGRPKVDAMNSGGPVGSLQSTRLGMWTSMAYPDMSRTSGCPGG